MTNRPNQSVGVKERNLGIELLRIVSMFLIIVLHCLGLGGAGKCAPEHTVQNSILWFLTAACYGSANLYALTSGYVCIRATHRWERMIELWLQVFLYSVGIFAVDRIFGGSGDLSWRQIISLLLPVTSNRYWYFSAYFFLFAFLPFINPLLERLSKRQYQILLLLLFVFFCIGGWLSDTLAAYAFSTAGGYSPMWLMALYCTGAYLRRFEIPLGRSGKRKALACFVVCTLLTWGSMHLINLATNLLLGREVQKRLMFYSYLSPTVVLGAVALFLFFSQVEVRHGKKLLTTVSATTFGIYLIHVHPSFSARFLDHFFLRFSDISFVGLLTCILVYSVLLFLFCGAVDFVRLQVFRLLNVRKFSAWVVRTVKKPMDKLLGKG